MQFARFNVNALAFSLVFVSLIVSTAAFAELKKTQFPTEWKAKTQAAKLVILEFSTPWCASCQKLKPTVSSLEKRYGKHLAVLNVNLDLPENQRYAEKFAIESAPTFVFYGKNREWKERIDRDITPAELEGLVAKQLGQ
ncbi:MAG: thioredoxin family protein [Cyanobacteria bacterium]|nr:thioredoxin family protein [Cyanobacteriota bacterium]